MGVGGEGGYQSKHVHKRKMAWMDTVLIITWLCVWQLFYIALQAEKQKKHLTGVKGGKRKKTEEAKTGTTIAGFHNYNKSSYQINIVYLPQNHVTVLSKKYSCALLLDKLIKRLQYKPWYEQKDLINTKQWYWLAGSFKTQYQWIIK